MSYPAGNARRPYDNGGSVNLPYGATVPHLRGGDGSVGMGGGTDRLVYEDIALPLKSYDNGRGDNASEDREVPPPVAWEFNFNRISDPLPWHEIDHLDSSWNQEPEPKNGSKARRFAECANPELLVYLEQRQVALEFLREIDLFIEGHPEISDCQEGRKLLQKINTEPPFAAYLSFLKGYLRPARYIDGIIRTDHFRISPSFPYCPLSKKADLEIDDFFKGHDFRDDVVQKIDQEVQMGIHNLNQGYFVPLALRKLVSYALWGNPIDAFKWYEYCYQQDYLPHHYLPEHCVLTGVAKDTSRVEPRMVLNRDRKKYLGVRRRMAHAQEQGLDVVAVLLQEFRFALIRKGHRRVDIDKLCAKAKQCLDEERKAKTGIEIVDMIMDNVSSYVVRPRRGNYHRIVARGTFSRRTRTYVNAKANALYGGHNGHHIAQRNFQLTKGKKMYDVVVADYRAHRRAEIMTEVSKYGNWTFKQVAVFLRVQAKDLRRAKDSLEQMYRFEHATLSSSSSESYRARRATAERRYVGYLCKYLRDANLMDKDAEAQLRAEFTRKKMGSSSLPSRDYLLSFWPWGL